MKRVLLFDLGGTLVEYYTREQFPQILRNAILEVGDYLQENGLVGELPMSIWDTVRTEDYESPDHCVRPLEGRLVRIFRLDESSLSGDVSMTMCEHFLRPIFRVGRLYDDTIPVLSELTERGFGTAVVSNTPWGSPAELWRKELADIGLAKYLDTTVFCRDVGHRKPSRRIFEYVLEMIGAPAEDCIFIGDNPQWDVDGPISVGIAALQIDRSDILANCTEDKLNSLSELFQKLDS